MAQLIREWVMSCEQCIRESRIDRSLARLPPQNPNKHIAAPEDDMQIDLVPKLPPSGGYENIVTAMDVFSRYFFAYLTSNQDATAIAKVIINIMTKHAYLPTTLILGEGTAFTSHVIKEVAGVLGITLKHATTKHAQTIGLLERSHAPIKQSLKIETSERRSLWQKNISVAVLNYNTSYHSSISCEPSREFHGRIPYKILDLKMGIRPQKLPSPDSEIAQDVLEQTEMISNTSEEIPCKLVSNTKPNMIKKPMLQNSNKQIRLRLTAGSVSLKRKPNPCTDFGLNLLLLKRCYRPTYIWKAKLAPIKRKCFIEWGYANSHPANIYWIFKSHHLIGNHTQKVSLNTMICTPEHGSVNTRSQSLVTTTIIW